MCVWVGVGICVFVCVCERSCRADAGAEEERSGRRQKTEEEQWMYSAVIHKVESTTKLLATV